MDGQFMMTGVGDEEVAERPCAGYLVQMFRHNTQRNQSRLELTGPSDSVTRSPQRGHGMPSACGWRDGGVGSVNTTLIGHLDRNFQTAGDCTNLHTLARL